MTAAKDPRDWRIVDTVGGPAAVKVVVTMTAAVIQMSMGSAKKQKGAVMMAHTY